MEFFKGFDQEFGSILDNPEEEDVDDKNNQYSAENDINIQYLENDINIQSSDEDDDINTQYSDDDDVYVQYSDDDDFNIHNSDEHDPFLIIKSLAQKHLNDSQLIIFDQQSTIILMSIDSPEHASIISQCFLFIKDLDLNKINEKFAIFLLDLFDALYFFNDFSLFSVISIVEIYQLQFSSYSFIISLLLVFDRFSKSFSCLLFPAHEICDILNIKLQSIDFFPKLLSNPDIKHAFLSVYIYGLDHQCIHPLDFQAIIHNLILTSSISLTSLYEDLSFCSKETLLLFFINYCPLYLTKEDILNYIEVAESSLTQPLLSSFINFLYEKDSTYLAIFKEDEYQELFDFCLLCYHTDLKVESLLKFLIKEFGNSITIPARLDIQH